MIGYETTPTVADGISNTDTAPMYQCTTDTNYWDQYESFDTGTSYNATSGSYYFEDEPIEQPEPAQEFPECQQDRIYQEAEFIRFQIGPHMRHAVAAA